MTLALDVLSVAALLLIVLGPWLAIVAGSLVPYRLGRRRPRPALASPFGVAALLALGAAIVLWGAYVGPALHKPGQSCPDPAWGVVFGGYASVILPPALLSAAAGLMLAPRTRDALKLLTMIAAPAALIALLFLQRGMFCHFGD